MKNNMLKDKLIRTLVCILAFIILVYLILQIKFVREILFLIVISFTLSYSLKPLQNLLIKKGLNDKFSAILLILTLIVGLIFTFIILIPSIFKESLTIGNSLDEFKLFINNLQIKLNLLDDNKIVYDILSTLYAKGNRYIISLIENLLKFSGNIGENILSYVVVPIITYYFLSDSSYIENKFLLIFPVKSRNIVKRINKDVDKILGRYIASKFILCLLVGILTFIILTIFDVKFPLILSIFNGIFNIIPYFGPIIGMIPAVILALLKSTKTFLYTLIFLYMLQVIEGNILSPKLTSESVNIHPLLVIIILIIGGEVGGFLGMIFAIPIAVIIKVIYEDLNYYLF